MPKTDRCPNTITDATAENVTWRCIEKEGHGGPCRASVPHWGSERQQQLEAVLTAIAAGVPRDEEWRSAADFMDRTAWLLDAARFPRPRRYTE
jgi:hypothetical protein